MPMYRVIWSIDIEADSPKDAAKEALAIQRGHGSTAVVFDVFNDSDPNDAGETIDLLEEDEE